MSWMEQGFDSAASAQIEKRQFKEAPKVRKSFFRDLVSKVEDKNCCAISHTPYDPEDIKSSSNVLAKQPAKASSKKKREPIGVYRPPRGYHQSILDSKASDKNSNLTSNSPLNSKLESQNNVGKNYKRSNQDVKNSDNYRVSCESSDCKIAELKNNGDSFSGAHTVSFNKDKIKLKTYREELTSITITKKISTNDSNFVSGIPKVASQNDKKLPEITSQEEHKLSEITSQEDHKLPEITSQKDHKLTAVTSQLFLKSEISSSLSSPSSNGSFSNVYDFTQPNFSFTDNWNSVPETSSFNDVDYIPPPKPVLPINCETSEVFDSVPSVNLNLNKDHFRHFEDTVSKNQSILQSNKLDLQVCEVTSTVPGGENLVVETKTTVSSEDDQVCEVQSTDSNEDQVVDCEIIEEIGEFLQKLEFERSMPKSIAEKILNDLKNFIRYYFNGNSVKLYGSYWSDAAITTSNINLALETEQPIKNGFLLCMQKTLAKELKNYKVSPFEEEANPRRSKIFFVDNEHGISCELMYLGSKVSQYIQLSNIIKAVCDFNSKIKTLVIATKLWAEALGINEAENGKLHPVGFTLLVLHYLQQLEKPLLPLLDVSSRNWGLNEFPVKNNSSVGELWINFLKYYSYKFNWTENVITVTDKAPVLKNTKLWQVSWIGIEDPVSKKNVADSVITSDTAEFITSCFKKSYQYFISAPCDSDSTSSSGSDNNGSQNIRRRSVFKLSDCVSHPPPIFCSDDDSDYENCYVPQRLSFVEPLKFSKISEVSLKCVDQVLKEVYDEYKLPDNQVKGRKNFVEDLEKYIRRLYPDAKLKLFGSTVNGFGFKRSDLDICMTFKRKYQNNGSAGNILRRLVYHLRRKDGLKNVFGLYSAQVPIIKFNFTTQNWNCDLSFYNVLAVHNSELLYKYSMMDENCRILGCALKLLAKKTLIADCSSKTLSSYSYILMVIHFLQQVNPPVLPVMPVHDKEEFEKEIDEKELERKGVLKNQNYWFFEDVDQLKNRYLGVEQNSSSVGELWLEMLEYYLKMDYERAVSITEKDPVSSSSLLRYARLINIEDPFLSKRNLGCIVSEGKADETRKIFHRARMLFGSDYSCDMKNLKEHYFSPSNLTGRIMKNIECIACGGFGHETKECPKADPFKNRMPWNPSRNRATKFKQMNSRKP